MLQEFHNFSGMTEFEVATLAQNQAAVRLRPVLCTATQPHPAMTNACNLESWKLA